MLALQRHELLARLVEHLFGVTKLCRGSGSRIGPWCPLRYTGQGGHYECNLTQPLHH